MVDCPVFVQQSMAQTPTVDIVMIENEKEQSLSSDVCGRD